MAVKQKGITVESFRHPVEMQRIEIETDQIAVQSFRLFGQIIGDRRHALLQGEKKSLGRIIMNAIVGIRLGFLDLFI